jgi:hypothetical protein
MAAFSTKLRDTSIIGAGKYTNIDDLLVVFHSSAGSADFNSYFGCFAQGSRFLGTAAKENWTVEEFMDYCRPAAEEGRGWSFEIIADSRKISYYPIGATDPDFATFDELLNSESFPCVCRGSGSAIFNKLTKTWLLTHYHLVFPIPDDIAMDICERISLFDKGLAAARNEEELLASLSLEEPSNTTKSKSKPKKKKK